MIIYNFLKHLMLYIKYNKILNKAYRNENILSGLSQLLGVELKQDWIGRVYAVINPFIKDGVYDRTSAVYELGNDNPTEQIVEKFIMERMNIAHMFIQNNNLFDLLTYQIKKLDSYDNYLFIMEPLPWQDLLIWAKRLMWLILGSIVVAILLIIFL